MENSEREALRARLEPFVAQLVKTAGLELKFQIEFSGSSSEQAADSPDVVVNFSGPDVDLLLQHGGELLAALEDVALRVLRLRSEDRGRVAFDCGDYKALRVEELRLMAETAAERVERTGAPFAFSPMDSRDRRLIHLFLKDRLAIRTESQGFGPNRKVVIFQVGSEPQRPA